MSFDLKDRIASLLLNEPFFASLSRNINKVESTAIPTAGVRVTEDGRYEMVYNNEFFSKLPPEQQLGVLKHEFLHLVLDHVGSRKVEGVSHQMHNIAADLAINSHLQGELPDNCCMPGVGPFKDYPLGESLEWYLTKMLDEQEEQTDGSPSDKGEGSASGEGEGDGGGAGDGEGGEQTDEMSGDHSQWSDAKGNEVTPAEQMAKQRLKEDVKKAASAASANGKGWGSVSSATKKMILERLETKVDWRKVLRYFIKTSQRSSRSSSIKRINTRYAYIHPGKRVQRSAKVAIAIDQSGSVDDQMLAAFFSELNKLSKLATFIVVPFDTEVDESKVYEWKKGQRKSTERVLNGGTCFNAPTKWANENNVDGLIILTDMEASKPTRCSSQRMWMTTKACASRPYFSTNERIIAID